MPIGIGIRSFRHPAGTYSNLFVGSQHREYRVARTNESQEGQMHTQCTLHKPQILAPQGTRRRAHPQPCGVCCGERELSTASTHRSCECTTEQRQSKKDMVLTFSLFPDHTTFRELTKAKTLAGAGSGTNPAAVAIITVRKPATRHAMLQTPPWMYLGKHGAWRET